MNGNLTAALLGGLILFTALGVPVWARSSADETQLETLRQDIDKDATTTTRADRIQTLAGQFNVEPGTVERLRAGNQGWGETTIELAMAQRLTQTDPAAYPGMTEALNKIESLRSGKMGWGKIANDLGFKLGPVVSAAMHARNELRQQTRAESSAQTGKSEKAVKAGTARIEKGGRPDRASRPERPARPERAARAR